MTLDRWLVRALLLGLVCTGLAFLLGWEPVRIVAAGAAVLACGPQVTAMVGLRVVLGFARGPQVARG